MKIEDFKNILVEDFNYMVFSVAFDIEVTTSIEYSNVYGSPNTEDNKSGKLAYITSSGPSNRD